ncbi:LamG-like jellyroll fold domain-containing protein [Cohnella terricola]|uniref:Ig domain-containing protein n=1 Tax=Cohnella terricola TaxID=1289167 RepID=A0A559JT89_9BACL|nr:LamG-like jellyroll fold domain-containing protein [Cohnella terricola]TVY03099.1 Ig domain-containing protein [Cohnella terricola]
MQMSRVMHIPKRQEPPQVLAHWIFDPIHTKSGSIQEGNLVLTDESGLCNHIELVTTQEGNQQLYNSHLEWMKDTSGGASLSLYNDRCEKGTGCYFRTVKDAPLNHERFEQGYTIEAVVKMPELFDENRHSWMGVLTRQGRAADLGKSGENELLATLSISNCKEYQWVCHPTNQTSSVTNWSRYMKPGQWHHVVIVNDTIQTLLYVDGICDFNSPSRDIMGVSVIAGNAWNIGASEWGGQLDQLFSGSIREIRITGEPLERSDWLHDSKPRQVLQGTNEEPPLSFQSSAYHFVLVPDAQKLVYLNPEMFDAQMKWIVDNHSRMNIAMTAFVGDIVDHSDAPDEWDRSSRAISLLDQSHTPYMMTAGNHDYDAVDTYLQHFGPDRFRGKEHYKGHSPSRYSSYGFIKAGSYNYLWLMADMQYLLQDMAWCKAVLEEHRQMPTIIVSHDILYATKDGERRTSHESENGRIIWEQLVAPYNQVFMTVNGHYDGTVHHTRKNNSDHEVIQLLVNYQDSYRGGNGWMRLAGFNEEANQISFLTYSPWVEQLGKNEPLSYPDYRYLTGEYHTFVIPFFFKKRFDFVTES